MQIARLHTCISREKLKSNSTEPDKITNEAIDQVRETPESYFQPTVEMLNAMLTKKRTK
ncbi:MULTISPECIES: hypothetical protein [unclassified Paenibacillus]|uniref:hypothetical protein n=1 Tax=unclassified Paenibacillus TaxID=185978 RepID=UPI001AE134FD|nr:MULTISPECIES: hypothetical protein [unclassified Paenibacillus]MBP1157690.1 hypothetical protein [Paenibacillus sp. PvP091]MBP1171573.1 hypothetical protein [Paenibacillus sp. PvR098]MBP2437954.1 hypothetical protein [Paenibacillus sp. PvP052]